MMVRYLFATFHLIALAIGIAAVYGRWRSLQRVKSTTDLPAVFHADNWYGIAVVIWVATGLVRAWLIPFLPGSGSELQPPFP